MARYGKTFFVPLYRAVGMDKIANELDIDEDIPSRLKEYFTDEELRILDTNLIPFHNCI